MTLTIEHPPKRIYDQAGQLVEVIVTYEDYKRYLKTLAENSDWEDLPPHLQDAIDLMLIEEAKVEGSATKPLSQFMAEVEHT